MILLAAACSGAPATPLAAPATVATAIPFTAALMSAPAGDVDSPLPTPTATLSAAEVETAQINTHAPPALRQFFITHAAADAAELKRAADQFAADDPAGDYITRLEALIVPGSEQAGMPVLLFTWHHDDPQRSLPYSLIAWRDPGGDRWRIQMMTIGYHVVEEGLRAQADDGQVYLGVIRNGCSMSSIGYCDDLGLMRYSAGWWQGAGPADWNSSLAQAHFVGDGLDTVAVRNADWELTDDKSRIFRPNHGGLHRWFNEIWQWQGDRYVRMSRQVEPSPYNTLLEFLDALRNGGDAAAWTASPDVLVQAAQLGLPQSAGSEASCPVWQTPECEQTGPLSFGLEQRRLCADFLRREDGDVRIRQIRQLDEGAESCIRNNAADVDLPLAATVAALGLSFNLPEGALLDPASPILTAGTPQTLIFSLFLPFETYSQGNIVQGRVLPYHAPEGGLTRAWLDKLYVVRRAQGEDPFAQSFFPFTSYEWRQWADSDAERQHVALENREDRFAYHVYVAHGKLVLEFFVPAYQETARFLPAFLASLRWTEDAPTTLDAFYGDDVTPTDLEEAYQVLTGTGAATPVP